MDAVGQNVTEGEEASELKVDDNESILHSFTKEGGR